MKKMVIIVMAGLVLNLTGCVSYYNHNRVQNNAIKQHAIATGDTQTLKYIAAGTPPKQAIRIRALETDGEVEGLSIAFSPMELGGYFSTFKSAPVSSTFSLLADGAIAYGLATLVEEISDSSSSTSSDSSESTHSTLSINTTGNSNVYNINNFQPQDAGGSGSTGNTGSGGVGNVGM